MGVLGGELSNINGYEHVVEKSMEGKVDELIQEEKDKQAFRKYDQGKLRYDLMPAKTFEQIVDVLTYGANKYTTKDSDGANNWHKCPDPDTRYYAALMRHVESFRKGEYYDKESGRPHLAHALCCLIFILEYHNMHDKKEK